MSCDVRVKSYFLSSLYDFCLISFTMNLSHQKRLNHHIIKDLARFIYFYYMLLYVSYIIILYNMCNNMFHMCNYHINIFRYLKRQLIIGIPSLYLKKRPLTIPDAQIYLRIHQKYMHYEHFFQMEISVKLCPTFSVRFENTEQTLHSFFFCSTK